ncbi:MAG: hemerythrin [Candidatus Contendobacter odensis]|uniref:Hemerythrin n=1 Tax=Candidatus Contendibacter odensensis TaxID=1400860 RepID=A0A2G6PGQ3_9GAMM|nr:MAG: hemerythrin [Candidatus Contendobacter odensis]
MPFANWKEFYSLNMPDIDEQHKKLFELVNQLWDAIACKRSPEIQLKAIEELELYTDYHFRLEEDFMREIGYPEFDAHYAMHQQFIKKIADSRKEMISEGNLPIDLLSFFNNWLANHILIEDKKYVRFFSDKVKANSSRPSLVGMFFKKMTGR